VVTTRGESPGVSPLSAGGTIRTLLDDVGCRAVPAVSGYGSRLGTQIRAHAGFVGTHTYTSPMQAHARMLGYDCYEYVIDQVLDASCDGSPCLILFCIALVSSWIFFIHERGSWSLLAPFISSLYYYYLGSLVNSIRKMI
jgi:hypothetical protein